MTDTADLTPTMTFANEVTEGSLVSVRCHQRTDPIKTADDELTGFASCVYLSRPHESGGHALTIERLRVGPGVVRAIARNEDGEQVGWSAHKDDPTRILQ